LGPYFAEVLELNRVRRSVFVEPFAGGAGAALYLLNQRLVSAIHLNDVDRAVFAFWHTVTRSNAKLRARIATIPVTRAEWIRQKAVYRERARAPLFDLGVATLFLNRTNRSGILRAGMIGGHSQAGRWKLNARFDRSRVLERIERIGRLASAISITNDDVRYVDDLTFGLRDRAIVYLDPPYVSKSQDLYVNHFSEDDHAELADTIRFSPSYLRWIVTYDDASLVRSLYKGYATRTLRLTYTADTHRHGRERMIFSDALHVPRPRNPLA
jgi:DNA adenine methylase